MIGGSITFLIYLFMFRPFKDKMPNAIAIVSEFILMLFSVAMLAFHFGMVET